MTLFLRVNAYPDATGRPDEVLKALNLTNVPRRMTRSRLVLRHVAPEEPEPGAEAPG